MENVLGVTSTDTYKLSTAGKHNEELFDQAFCIQDHMQSQVSETERLIQQVTHLQALQSAALSAARALPLAGTTTPVSAESRWYPNAAPGFQVPSYNGCDFHIHTHLSAL